MWVDVNYEIERLKNLKESIKNQYQKEINIVGQKIMVTIYMNYDKELLEDLGKSYKQLSIEEEEFVREIEEDLKIILKAKEVFKKYMLTGIQK